VDLGLLDVAVAPIIVLPVQFLQQKVLYTSLYLRNPNQSLRSAENMVARAFFT
jgi:hypothetical protein